MYKISEDLKNRIIEAIQSNLSIRIPNNRGNEDCRCSYCYEYESIMGSIIHDEDCEGKQLIYLLNLLSAQEDRH